MKFWFLSFYQWLWPKLIVGINVRPVVSFVYQVDEFLQALVSYDKEHIPESCLTVVKQEYLRKAEFHPDQVRTKSTAAAGLCAWTINIVRYYEVSRSAHEGLQGKQTDAGP